MKKVLIFLIFLLTLNTASAVIINSVLTDTISPGKEGQIRIEIENTLNEDVEDVSLSLSFMNLPFIPIGTSEQSVEEIDEDDDEDFVFRIKAAPDIEAGDYEVPYIITYNQNQIIKTKEGTIGIKVKANPDLSFTADTSNPIKGRQGQVSLKIVNKGFYDARFVSVDLIPDGFTLLSEKEVYIGEVESDDFETASFDVIFNSVNADLVATIEYTNFDNEKVAEDVQIPLTVYTPEKAVELGIIQKGNSQALISLVVTLILIIILWRILKKRKRLKRSMENKR